MEVNDGPHVDDPRFPRQRRGAAYWLGTWTGRILIVNTVVFILTCLRSGSIMLPDTATLLAIGAKDPVGLAKGELWRYFTPIFIHIGIIHFAVNSFVLHVIGRQLEGIIGPRWFLGLYMISGLAGCVASAVFSVNLSAGASGAIFGLLGVGYFIERSIGKRVREMTGQAPQNRAYAMTVLMNLGLGFMIPMIDNAAHIGGLVAGIIGTYAMVNLRPNRLAVPRKKRGIAALLLLGGLIIAGGVLGSNRAYILDRLDRAVGESEHALAKVEYLSQIVSIDPENADAILELARLYYALEDDNAAVQNIRYVIQRLGEREKVAKLADDLEAMGLTDEAWFVRRLLAHQP